MRLKKLFISLLLALFGVSAMAAQGSNASISWLNSPPSDSSEYFYAVGYGETISDAKSDALATISAKISVSVASSFSSSVSASRLNGDEEVLNESKNEVVSKSKNIDYTDVKVQESFDDGKQWAVLVEVDRAILVNSYERRLNGVDAKIKAEWEVFAQSTSLEKLKLSSTINKYLKETDTFFALLHALSSKYDDGKYMTRYLNYTKEMRKAKSELTFKIKSDALSQQLASLVRSELSKDNVSFSDKNYNVLIDISTKAREQKYPSANKEFANLTFALRDTSIALIDKSGKIVSTTVHKTKESSPSGFGDAIAKTAKYEAKIKENGIMAFITGN